jgi:transcriptional regulator with XRE-family HTH domain
VLKPPVAIDATAGDRIFALRQAKGWSQSELARQSGVGRTTIVMAEGGRRLPRPSTLRRIAWTLGVSLDELLHGEGPKT